ncbi:UNVERIFIED_CONTAM: hypothetical protein PYX00_003984 [Menopon gallinae]|uniref:Retinol dehydrogenase 12 n=1 Tax=Menopon gallinae TaxID=328185 RepID=A0AAW2I3Z0_9NEOP
MYAHFFPPKCKSSERLDGKTVVLTGCNTGIGKHNALDFCKRGARVIMACRSKERAEKAMNDILEELKEEKNIGVLIFKKLELSSLDSVRNCAREILDEEPRIDILVNNAGIMMCPFEKTEDGVEKQFGTNHLGHFLFTLLLLPRIIKSAPARIVNVSSVAHTWSNDTFDDINYEKTKYSPLKAYGRSKLANVLFTKELARRLEGTSVTTYAVHPGAVETELGRHLDESYFSGLRSIIRFFGSWVLRTPVQGAQTTIYCSVDKATAGETGLYYSNCRVTQPSNEAEDPDLAKKLWDVSSELVKLGDFDPFAPEDASKAVQ